jgi:hypothetical protein
MLTTFDVAEVQAFVDDMDVRMKRCENGEGIACATLDTTMRTHSQLCCEYTNAVLTWGHNIFRGTIAFDPRVESLWREQGSRLYARGVELNSLGRSQEVPCYVLDSLSQLGFALWRLGHLLKNWVTPGLAVGLSARRQLVTDPKELEEIKRRLESLEGLPADWQPRDPRQQAIVRMLKNSVCATPTPSTE